MYIFSIIIPVYNIEDYISECVGSMMPLKNDEQLIIVDDGSPDNAGEICDTLAKDHENIIVIHKENGGLSSARNCGLERASGRYILFVDGDDRIDRRVLDELRGFTEEEPDVIFCDIVKEWPDGRIKPMGDGITEEIGELRGIGLVQYIAGIKKLPGAACGKAFSREFLIKNSLFFREGILSEDIEWSFRLYSLIDSALYCKRALYYYRQERPGSITTARSSRHALDLLGTVEEYAAVLKDMQQGDMSAERFEAVKELYQSFLEYELRVLFVKRNDVKDERREDFRRRLKKLKYLTGYRRDIKSRMIAILYRVLI